MPARPHLDHGAPPEMGPCVKRQAKARSVSLRAREVFLQIRKFLLKRDRCNIFGKRIGCGLRERNTLQIWMIGTVFRILRSKSTKRRPKIANPRITITVRQDQLEQIEARARSRNLSRGRMIEYLLDQGLAAEELAELEHRSPVVARLDELTAAVEELHNEIAAHVTEVSEKRIIPRVVDAAIRSQMVFEMFTKISRPAAELDREQLRADAYRALRRGTPAAEVREGPTWTG